jgi:hypothetical protein
MINVPLSTLHYLDWRGARVVEWGGLENRCGGNFTQGSNPCLSARKAEIRVRDWELAIVNGEVSERPKEHDWKSQ